MLMVENREGDTCQLDVTGWSYYDFTNNWERFYEVWTLPPVQESLAEAMERWCETEAYFELDGKRPLWQPKKDLWRYSRTDYHFSRMLKNADDYVSKHRLVERYRESVRRAGRAGYSQKQAEEDFYTDGAFDMIVDDCEPEPGSQEANILMMGANYLSDAMLAAAEITFPDPTDQAYIFVGEYPSRGEDSHYNQVEVVLIPSKKIVFDFNRQYLYTEAPSEDLSPDKIVESVMGVAQ